jgi:hypothetical protein
MDGVCPAATLAPGNVRSPLVKAPASQRCSTSESKLRSKGCAQASPQATPRSFIGQFFVSGEVTPMFALAAGVSEYYDNKWYVAAPIYSLALLDGFGRMGHNAHWFSYVIGAALLGVGTTELFLYLHRRHQENPDSFKIFAISAPPAPSRAQQTLVPAGIGVAFSW